MLSRTTDVDAALAALEGTFVACRARHHAWDPHTARRVPGGYEVTECCGRCDTLRRITLDTRWGLTGPPRYTWPPGYRISGLGRLTGADRNRVRRAAIAGLVD